MAARLPASLFFLALRAAEHDSLPAARWHGIDSASGPRIPAPRARAAAAQTNPIRWALSLRCGAAASAFGAGYFDDAADVPGEPVLFLALRGSVERDGTVRLVKVPPVCPGRPPTQPACQPCLPCLPNLSSYLPCPPLTCHWHASSAGG